MPETLTVTDPDGETSYVCRWLSSETNRDEVLADLVGWLEPRFPAPAA